jgi:hypothetical protein
MHWWAAHIVTLVRFEGTKRKQIVFENILLVKARNDDEAWAKAEALGPYQDGPSEWNGESTVWEFVGVRKVVTTLCDGRIPRHGDEVSFTELRLDSLDAVKRFAAGKSVRVQCLDELRKRRERRKQAIKSKRAT